ncbi:MarC family protein, partial [Enterobacter hormaechei]|uniref:MarC family protein n=1 Tax=Enterobacter hormaechei TaxID=158836 RepID=UPI003D6F9583
LAVGEGPPPAWHKARGEPGAIEAISRLMGFLLVCMGVQFIINGVLEIVKTYH